MSPEGRGETMLCYAFRKGGRAVELGNWTRRESRRSRRSGRDIERTCFGRIMLLQIKVFSSLQRDIARGIMNIELQGICLSKYQTYIPTRGKSQHFEYIVALQICCPCPCLHRPHLFSHREPSSHGKMTMCNRNWQPNLDWQMPRYVCSCDGLSTRDYFI